MGTELSVSLLGGCIYIFNHWLLLQSSHDLEHLMPYLLNGTKYTTNWKLNVQKSMSCIFKSHLELPGAALLFQKCCDNTQSVQLKVLGYKGENREVTSVVNWADSFSSSFQRNLGTQTLCFHPSNLVLRTA